MHTFIQRPNPRLAPYITQYWSWQLPAGTTIPTIYAGTGVECVFNLGDPIETVHPYSSIISTGESVILCPRKQHFRAIGTGKINLLSIRFRTTGFFRMFGIPLTELADRLTGTDNILPRHLLTEIFDKESPQSSVVLLDDYLSCQLDEIIEDNRMNILIDKVYYHRDIIKLNTIVQNSGISDRTFQRKFKLYTGVSGKYFQRTARFQSCVKLLSSNPKISYSHLALEHGYFDQAHFINEFKTFSGLTPQQYFNKKQNILSHYSNNFYSDSSTINNSIKHKFLIPR